MRQWIKIVLSFVSLLSFGYFFWSLYSIDIVWISLGFLIRYVCSSLVYYSYNQHTWNKFLHRANIGIVICVSFWRFWAIGFSLASFLIPFLTLWIYYFFVVSKKNYHKRTMSFGTRWYLSAWSTGTILLLTFLLGSVIIGRIESIEPNCTTIVTNIEKRQGSQDWINGWSSQQDWQDMFDTLWTSFQNGESFWTTIKWYREEITSQIGQQRALVTQQICESTTAAIQTNVQKPTIQLAILASLGLILWPALWILFVILKVFTSLILLLSKRGKLYKKKIITKEIEIWE
jgi:hypothetical protein